MWTILDRAVMSKTNSRIFCKNIIANGRCKCGSSSLFIDILINWIKSEKCIRRLISALFFWQELDSIQTVNSLPSFDNPSRQPNYPRPK